MSERITEPRRVAAPGPSRPAEREAGPWPARWNHLVTLVGTAAVVTLGWRHRALADDGLIFLRTVRQILAGNGPVVNAGERVEANTSTAWQWLLVLLGAVSPGDLGFTAVVAGLTLTGAGFALALDATRRLACADGARPLLPLGVLLPLAVPVFWDFATAGLDSGLMFCWLGGCWWLLVRAARPCGSGASAAHAAWFGAGFLVRPDMTPVGLVFLLAFWWAARPSWRAWLAQAAAAAALPAAYEVFRAGYYGILTPLPALTKEAGATQASRGLAYLRDFAGPYHLYAAVPLVAVALAWAPAASARRPAAPGRTADPRAARAARVVPAAPVAAALLLLAYVVRLGGDYMHGRMLLPVTFLLVLPVLVVPVTRRGVLLAGATAVWAVACAGPWNPAAYHGHDRATTARVRDGDIALTGDRNADHTADWTTAFSGLRVSVAAGLAAGRPVYVRLADDGTPAGLIPLNPAYGAEVSLPGGYLGVTGQMVPLDQRIVEIWGLANTLGAHLEYMPGWRELWPGHRKLLDDVWLLALELDPAVTEPPPGFPSVTAGSLAAARRVLGCGDVRELLDSVREPLTVRRFWDNLTGAPARTALRIPRDPFAAVERFCRP